VGKTKNLPLSAERNLEVGSSLSSKGEIVIGETLRRNANLFAWLVADLPEVDPKVVVHKLSMFKGVRFLKEKEVRERGKTSGQGRGR